jgi:hypothetical protein
MSIACYPAVSTIFYSILSNFSFIYFIQLELVCNSITEFELLASVKDYISHIQDIARATKIILNKDSANRQEEVWKAITRTISKQLHKRGWLCKNE